MAAVPLTEHILRASIIDSVRINLGGAGHLRAGKQMPARSIRCWYACASAPRKRKKTYRCVAHTLWRIRDMRCVGAERHRRRRSSLSASQNRRNILRSPLGGALVALCAHARSGNSARIWQTS